MTNMNAKAYEIARRAETKAESLGISSEKLACGATVVDFGVKVNGSHEAGRIFSEACLGGLGKVDFCTLSFDNLTIPGVRVTVSDPVKACMACQYAGWHIDVQTENHKAYRAMGSGPARILYGKEPLLQDLGLTENADVAVLALESHKIPPDGVAAWIAGKCRISPERLILMVAPTASMVGSVQVAARVVETGMHKMVEVGFDINSIHSGFGVCPIAPVARDNLRAIGRTNDAVLYGGQAWYTADTGPDKIRTAIEKLPSSASEDYGALFYDIFLRYDSDFYKIDPLLFSPAEVTIQDLVSGRSFQAGQVNPELLKESLLS